MLRGCTQRAWIVLFLLFSILLRCPLFPLFVCLFFCFFCLLLSPSLLAATTAVWRPSGDLYSHGHPELGLGLGLGFGGRPESRWCVPRDAG